MLACCPSRSTAGGPSRDAGVGRSCCGSRSKSKRHGTRKSFEVVSTRANRFREVTMHLRSSNGAGAHFVKRTAALVGALAAFIYVAPVLVAPPSAWAAAQKDYGKPGDPIELVIGYQPYYTESWSGVIMRDKKFYEKYLPKGSNVTFQVGLQGAIIVNGMLAGKVDIGYVGDMPGIVSTSHPDVRDVRIVSVLGLGYDQCNIFLARPDAPQFKSPEDAIKWLNGKTVAVPKGSCTDRFA